MKLVISFITLIFFFISSSAYAHNGSFGYGYPVDNINVDGDLSDWPEIVPSYTINHLLSQNPGDSQDINASFKLGYHKNTLYVGLSMQSPSYNKSKYEYSIYIDASHSSTKGSGVVVLNFDNDLINFSKPRSQWDPENSELNSKKIVVRSKTEGDKTTFEWEIPLDSRLESNKSIGFDIHIKDTVDDDKHTAAFWGSGPYKGVIPSHLGDMVLFSEKVETGILRGNIAWEQPSDYALPDSVKIMSVDNELLWVQLPVDKNGLFEGELPIGEYNVTSLFKNTVSLSSGNSKEAIRIDELSSVAVEVRSGQKTKPVSLSLKNYSAPDFLIKKNGFLLVYDEARLAELKNFVETYRQYYNIPGVSLALIHNGKIIYNESFGVQNTITQETVNKNTIYEAASVSKAVFAYAINRLAEKGVIGMEEPLFNYLPFNNIAHDQRAKLITAQMILSHQSGLPNWAWGSPFGWKRGDKTDLLFTPGTQYQYSGEGYEYLKRVVEKVTGKNIEAVLKQEVYKPLKMSNTSFASNENVSKHASVGHKAVYPMFWGLEDEPWVAGSMYTTSSDLATFLVGVLKGRGLSRDAHTKMLKPHIVNPDPNNYFNGTKMYHSLGFEIQDSPVGLVVHHGGNNGDFQSRIAMLPEKDLGYVLLTNNDSGYLLDLALQKYLLTGRH